MARSTGDIWTTKEGSAVITDHMGGSTSDIWTTWEGAPVIYYGSPGRGYQ